MNAPILPPSAMPLDHPVLWLIDELAAIETPDMRWLRENAEAARNLNAESEADQAIYAEGGE